MRKRSFVLFCLILSAGLFATDPVGVWTFDDSANLTAAQVGSPLTLVGVQTAVDGPEAGDGAVEIGPGSYYRCFHNIAANGDQANPQWVNKFTLAFDFRIPEGGIWHCFFQTNPANSNDGDAFVNPSNHIGVAATGYSYDDIIPGEWYRLVISANLGSHYDYYLDGQLLQSGGAQDFDGRFSIAPASGDNEVLLFADNDAEDNLIDCARFAVYDTDLSAQEIADLGGYGHTVEHPDNITLPTYLQTPTTDGVWVGWNHDASMSPIVEYGPTESLGSTVTGTVIQLGTGVWWHAAGITGLSPDTRYYYRVGSGDNVSEIRSFRTLPPLDSEAHIRFAVYADNQSNPEPHTRLVHGLTARAAALFGSQHNEDNLRFVLSAGDIVGNGLDLGLYQTEFFNPIASLSMNVPYQVSIGNHELEAPYFYYYMHNDPFQGPEGEYYYTFRAGRVKFIALDSSLQGTTQTGWLEAQLATAQTDPNIAMIFVFFHHPPLSEIWPDGNTTWSENTIEPLLAQYSKAVFFFNGHTHAYERGAHPVAALRSLIIGGGGGDLDRWGMYDNQENYPDIQNSLDQHCYAIFDVDPANASYEAWVYSLGNDNRSRDNELVDHFTYRAGDPAPEPPVPVTPAACTSLTPSLFALLPQGQHPECSVRWQLQAAGGNWSNCLLDRRIDAQDVYDDTGAPQWEPVDLNAGIDLQRLAIPAGILSNGYDYQWRVCRRDDNLKWSDWSPAQDFFSQDLPPRALLGASVTSGDAPLTVQFHDLSDPLPTAWSWDFNGDGTEDSPECDPVHIFTQPGIYNVGLTVWINGATFSAPQPLQITVTGTSVEDSTRPGFPVLAVQGNPFCVGSSVSYTIGDSGKVRLSLYNLRGERVAVLVDEARAAGSHRLIWNGLDDRGRAAPQGVYLCRLEAPRGTASCKLTLLR
jgi:hypothetical protein